MLLIHGIANVDPLSCRYLRLLRFAVPLGGLLLILGNTEALLINHRQTCLGLRVTLFCR